MTKIWFLVMIVIIFTQYNVECWRRRRRSCTRRNCIVSSWSTYTGCTATCGSSGTQKRTRRVTRGASCGGSCTFRLEETRACNRRCCPVNCAVSQWTSYSTCTHKCGTTGTQFRTRRKTRTESCNGVCPHGLRETKTCNRKCCPVNCAVSQWTPFSRCTHTCGTTGTQFRTRRKTRTESCKGVCPHGLRETKTCNRKCCPINCAVSQWTPFSKCTHTCGTRGTQFRTRKKTRTESCKGVCPHGLRETKTCNRKCCPVNCAVSQWTPFSRCTHTCGTTGTQFRTRRKTQTESCKGVCPHGLRETRTCNRKCCPVNCAVSQWTPFSRCTHTCGTRGTQFRTRKKTRTESCKGVCPHGLRETRTCNRKCCPVNCAVSQWTPFSRCTHTCGTRGTQFRTRKKTRTESCKGVCPHGLKETRTCNRKCCPVNCAVSQWTPFSKCTHTCGTRGTQYRTRKKTRTESCKGVCPHGLRETRTCNRKCCPVNCAVSQWTPFSKCTHTCGTRGTQYRTRKKTRKESCKGVCPHGLRETRTCNRKCCPVNCAVSQWTPFSRCTHTCGTTGTQFRTRKKTRTESCKGVCLHRLRETKRCNRKCCPVNCAVSQWTPFSRCTHTCGTTGTQFRTRRKTRTESCKGVCLHRLRETKKCNRKCCPVNCAVSQWTPFSRCTHTCGTLGTQYRTRKKTRKESCKGVCPHGLRETKTCNRKCCPVNCAVSQWTQFSKCSRPCGTLGTQFRTRRKTRTESCNGVCRHSLRNTQPCNRKCCPLNCEQKWSTWSTCSCSGRQRRRLLTTRKPACNGKSCGPSRNEQRSCRQRLRCRQGRCNSRRGVCICSAGYRGNACHQPCRRGTYGIKCAKRCICGRGTCGHTNGRCLCPLGLTGKRCQRPFLCSSGRYKCRHPNPRRMNCIVRYTTRSRFTSCPCATHRVTGCPPKTGCRTIRQQYYNGCMYRCRRGIRYSAAICCPKSKYRP